MIAVKVFHSKVEPSASNNANKSISVKCIICGENHLLQFCPKFKNKSVDQRKEFLDKNDRCYNCLGVKHKAEKCFSKMRFENCSGKHHTTLNINKNNNNKNNNNKNNKQNYNNNVSNNTNQTKSVEKSSVTTEQISLPSTS